MKLAVATKPTFFVEEDKIITRLFEEGLDYLFLYKEYAHPQFMERLLNLIPKKYHKRIYSCNNIRFTLVVFGSTNSIDADTTPSLVAQ